MSDPVFQPEEHAAENATRSGELSNQRPFDIVTLPSKGLLYTEGPLKGKEELEVYYLTAKEEDILTAPNLLRSGRVMDHLLRSVLVDRSINPEDLYLGDRNAILVWLRSTGYGAEYPVDISCRFCNSTFEHEFDLSELDIRFLEKEPDEEGLFYLPVTKKTVRVRFLTVADDYAVDKLVEQRAKKTGGSGNPMTAKLMAHVRDVEGLEPDARKNFIESLPVRDSKAIRSFISKYEPSIVMRQDAKCKSCGELNEEVVIPITQRFFWPEP